MKSLYVIIRVCYSKLVRRKEVREMVLLSALSVVINTLIFLGVTKLLLLESSKRVEKKKGESYFWQNIISYDHKKKGERND